MKNFFCELILLIKKEFLDLIGRSKIDTMPDIEYKGNFVVRHKASQILAKSIPSIAILIISIVCFILTHNSEENSNIYILFIVLGAITMIPAIYASQYKCYVDEECFVFCELFKKKTFLWSDIICARKIETKGQHSLTIALYNKGRRMIFCCDTDMRNAWHILKMVEAKNIYIKEEKELSQEEFDQV